MHPSAGHPDLSSAPEGIDRDVSQPAAPACARIPFLDMPQQSFIGLSVEEGAGVVQGVPKHGVPLSCLVRVTGNHLPERASYWPIRQSATVLLPDSGRLTVYQRRQLGRRVLCSSA